MHPAWTVEALFNPLPIKEACVRRIVRTEEFDRWVVMAFFAILTTVTFAFIPALAAHRAAVSVRAVLEPGPRSTEPETPTVGVPVALTTEGDP